MKFKKDKQYYKFSFYGFFKNLKLFDPFLLLFFISRGINYTEIGILYAFREFIINLFEIISGIIADVIGRKKAMIMAFVSYLISFFLFYALNDFIGYLVAFLFYGVGDAFRTGTHKAMINAYLVKNNWQDEKARYYGRTRAWSQRGSAISSALSAALFFYTGNYALMFLLTAIPYLFDLILLSSYPSYLNGDSFGEYDSIWKTLIGQIKAVFTALKSSLKINAIVLTSSYTGYYKAVKDYIQIIVASFSAVFVLSPDFTVKQNEAILIGGVYFLLYFLSSYASRNAFRVEQNSRSIKSGLFKIQLLGYGLGILAGVLFLMSLYFPALLCFGAILIFQNLRRPLGVKYISQQFEEKIMASVMSVESQSETLFAALMALILGFVVNYFGLGWGITSISALLFATTLIHRRI
ncbi:MAG: MFS transporter [Carboxylicivirga sp.]|nr:MFS transporter [Carboxylicivirga sp.]